MSLEARRGEIVALVGPSGGGKTTMLNLIPRFYDVTGGKVTIDGHDVRDVTLASLRRQIALVTQEPFLFDDTIRANIAYAKADASRRRDRGGRARRPRRTTSSWPCRRATRPRSARRARGSPAASASASPSPGPS